MNMREKLERALCCPNGCQNQGGDYDPIKGTVAICQAHTFSKSIDAILNVMRSPSNEAVKQLNCTSAGEQLFNESFVVGLLREYIDAIKAGK